MRILYITTVGMTMRFFQSFISELRKEGHTVDIACADTESIPEYYKKERFRIYRLSCSRSPFDFGNVRAIREIRIIVKKNKYDIVHCHTPVAAACTRFACRPLRRELGLKVFYTAHGFHFYSGAPKKNWLIYYPIEKWLSHYTDVLVTINKEDYFRAEKRFKPRRNVYVPGVGIDIRKFGVHHQGKVIRDGLEINKNQVMMLSVGELNDNKNHETVIRALREMPENLIYVIAGEGSKKEYLLKLSEMLGVQKRVMLVGYREDVANFYDVADLYILPSIREGLNVSLMEAMASGLPVVCSRIRGNTDLIKEGMGGFLFNPLDVHSVSSAIQKVLDCPNRTMGDYNKKCAKRFDIKFINCRLFELYKETSKAI